MTALRPLAACWEIFQKFFRNVILVASSLDPDKARQSNTCINWEVLKRKECYPSDKQFGPRSGRHFVGPDMGPNCSQRLSTDDTSK